MCKNLQLPGDFVWTPLTTSVPRTSWLASVYSRPLWGTPPQKKIRHLFPKNSTRPKKQRH